MTTPVIPTVVILPKDPTGQSPPAFANEIAQQSTTQQLMTIGRDSLIPIIYGGPERTSGMLYTARVDNTYHPGYLLLCLIICEGPIHSIDTVELNDVAAAAPDVYWTVYLGTQSQTVDPWLASAITGFNEPMLGTAYIVVAIRPGASQGFPRFTVQVKGRKVYDHRDGAQTLGVSSTYVWSDNPALCLADFLNNNTYGARKTVDWASVDTAANYCDQTVTGAGGAEKRALLTLTLAEKRPIKEWVDALRAYIPAWVDYAGDTAVIIADAPRSSDHTFTLSNINSDPPPMLVKRGIRDVPNVVQIGYMRTDVKPWVMDYAEAVWGNPADRRKTRIDMPGIRRFSQADRFATERINHYNLEDLEGQHTVFGNGLKVMFGDCGTITDNLGLSAKAVRITAREDRGHGSWVVGWREYDAAAYSSTVATSPSTPDTGLPNPRVVAAPTLIIVTETVYLEKNLAADSLPRGLIYQSRFDVTVTPPVHAYVFDYHWELYDGALKLRDETTTTPAWSTPPVQQGKTYMVNCYVRNSLGFVSPIVTDSKTAQGKLLPPGPVPSITRAFEIGGEVILEWLPAIDIDIEKYEWRYTPNQTAGGTWAAATVIDRIDALRAVFKGLPVGTHRFYVRALDSVGSYSTSDTTVDLTVTSDANAFLQDHEFTSPTLTNMVAIAQLEGVWKQRWQTSVTGDAWNSKIPNPVNSGGNPTASYHTSGTSKFQGDPWDLGALVTGDWTLTPNTTDITGTATYAIETSPDGVTYTPQAGVSYKGTARFVRPIIQTLTTGTIRITAPPKIALAAVTKQENSDPSAPVTSNLVGATTITLVNRYVKAVQITITTRGLVARSYTLDNIVVGLGAANTFDVYLFDQAGVQVASQFDWTWKGF